MSSVRNLTLTLVLLTLCWGQVRAQLECQEGYYGLNCKERCSVKCLDQICDKETGRCLRCQPGTIGDLCDQDVDLCATAPCNEGCIEINRNTTFQCLCRPGKQLKTDNITCTDVDLCATAPCSEGCIEINSNTSFQCLCRPGKQLTTDNITCTDADLCATAPCSEGCIESNSNTTFQCLCRPGKQLKTDNITCTDVDLCATAPCSEECIEVNGNTTVQCLCRPGKRLSTDNITCTDADLCATAPCSEGCIEINSNTTFHCLCRPGKQLKTDNITCTECQARYYGLNCSKRCNVSCVDQICDKTNGQCLRCPPGKNGPQCGQDMCSQDFCMNGGTCAGFSFCDCSMTDFFGERCQYTKKQVPITEYEFHSASNGIIYTSAGNITFYGKVTLNNDTDHIAIAVPAGSYLTLNDNMTRSCLDNIDNCTSGFSLTISYSFSSLDTTAKQVLATTGAGLEEGVKGVSLFFQSGQVYSDVVTSTQQWSVVRPFTMTDYEWVNITVSWHPGQGLWLLQGSTCNLIGYNGTPSTQHGNTNVSKPLLIGSPDEKSPSSVLYVRQLITILVFVKEAERSEEVTAIHVNTGDDDLSVGGIVAIILGIADFIALVCTAVWKVKRCWKKRRDKKEDSTDQNAQTISLKDTNVQQLIEIEKQKVTIENLKEKIKELQEQYKQEKDSAKTQHDGEIQRVKEDHAKVMQKTQEQHEKQLDKEKNSDNSSRSWCPIL